MSSGSFQNIETGSASSVLFEPSLIWVTIRRCWLWALPLGAILAGCVAYYLVTSFVPVYRASHLLEANRDFVVFQGVMPIIKDLARTEQALFMNSIVLDAVLADPEYRSAPSLSNPETAESNLIQNLWISSGGTESRLRVSYKDTDPDAAAMVCNAVVESYLRQRDAFDSERVSNLERWLAPEIQRWEQEVDRRQSVVQKLSEQTLGYAPAQQLSSFENESNLTLVAGLRKQITELNLLNSVSEAQLAMNADGATKANVEAIDGLPDANFEREEPAELEILKLIQLNPEVRRVKALQSRYEAAILEIEDKTEMGVRRHEYDRFKKNLARYREVLRRAEITARQQAIEQLTQLAEQRYVKQLKATRAKATATLKQAQENAQAQVAQEKKTLADRKAKLAVLMEQYNEERERLEQFGGTTAELQFSQEELSVANDVLHKLRERVAAIRTERRQDGAVRSLAPAKASRTPIESLPFKKLLVYSGAAMFVPFLLGLIWEIRTQRLTNSVMCDKTGLKVIGEISQLPSGNQLDRHRRLFHESVDTLRSSLFLSVDTRETRSIAVVSSMTGEGKSSVASQLALSIAKATKQTVLLIDADMRCPEQHDLFGLEMGPGLGGVLVGKVSLANAIDKTLGDRLHVLPAGEMSQAHHTHVTQVSMESLMKVAMQSYRYVIVDTAPVLSSGESLAVASSVDAALLCVMRDVSRVDTVMRARRRLEAAGATLVGTVFSGIPAWQYAYRYGNYYHDDNHQLSKAS